MIPFDEKYGEIHARIQEDRDLVRRIYDLARQMGLRDKNKRVDLGPNIVGPQQVYFQIGEAGGIPIGLDMNENHAPIFHQILAKMRLIYDLSEGTADLLSVYAVLDGRAGIVSEDVTCGDSHIIIPFTHISNVNPVIQTIFFDRTLSVEDTDLSLSTFKVYLENKLRGLIRYPIVDLDHLSYIKPEYVELFGQYTRQYQDDQRFRIREV